MLVLAIESSTRVASVALAQDDKVLGEVSSPDPKAHSDFINPAIEQILTQSKTKLSDLDLIAVDIGPGSFTGVRVAVNVARSLSYLLQKPIFAAQSLHLLLRQTSQDCIVMINAYKSMLFVCHQMNVSKGDLPLATSKVIPIDGLETYLRSLNITGPVRCVGDGYDAYYSEISSDVKKFLVRDSALSDFPSASTLSTQAILPQSIRSQTLDWKSIIPLYLRASAAEETLKSR